jgi:selenocysteine-specific elongation factor
MPVVGTAGHVDHGKSSLIEALTGTHPDRLPEERARGMTIDLGFAHFPGREGEPVGVVDVPGHERFLRNMVAGAWGLDAALLTVAADDGWMRQSEDHTRVLAALGVRRLVLAVTKSDLAPPERAEEVRRDSLARCARLGYGQVPSLVVSAHTGRNIAELRELLIGLLEGGPEQLDWGPEGCLLYVDRAFGVKGVGVVVTGTLKAGPVEQGQELRLMPAGKGVRVRGLQTYYREQERVMPGSRVALNLHGVELGEVRRGDCLVGPRGEAWAERELVAQVQPAGRPAADAEGAADAARELPAHGIPARTELEVALGTGHHPASFLRLEEGGLARLRFAEPPAAFWNQPCLLLRSGGSDILGAARLVWPGSADRRLGRRLAAALRDLPPDRRPSDYARLRLAVAGRIRRRELGSSVPAADTAADIVARGEWLFRSDVLAELEKEILRLASPAGGVPLGELSSRLGLEAEALGALIGELERSGRLALKAGLALLPANPEASLSPFAHGLLADLRRAGTAGLEPERLKIAGARKELAGLVRAGLAVSLDGAIFYAAETYLSLVRAVLAGRPAGSLLQIAEARAASGLSRKYLIPLLNRMETDGLVKREGDARRVRRLPD